MELDHVFVLCGRGAPEAEVLLRLGIREGAANTHPGQGTACRRFFFANAYLELLWVENAEETGSEAVQRTQLLDRWSLRRSGACPFGIILRPSSGGPEVAPDFPTWRYTPPYLPAGLAIEVADGMALDEPAVFYMAGLGPRRPRGEHSIDHAVPLVTVHRLSIEGPLPADRSLPRLSLEASGAVAFAEASAYLMSIDFSDAPRHAADLRPDLPIVLRW